MSICLITSTGSAPGSTPRCRGRVCAKVGTVKSCATRTEHGDTVLVLALVLPKRLIRALLPLGRHTWVPEGLTSIGPHSPVFGAKLLGIRVRSKCLHSSPIVTGLTTPQACWGGDLLGFISSPSAYLDAIKKSHEDTRT